MFSGARHGQRTFSMIREIRERVAFILRFLWTENFGTNAEVIYLSIDDFRNPRINGIRLSTKPEKEFFSRRCELMKPVIYADK
jgi:hypothetical protein